MCLGNARRTKSGGNLKLNTIRFITDPTARNLESTSRHVLGIISREGLQVYDLSNFPFLRRPLDSSLVVMNDGFLNSDIWGGQEKDLHATT